MLVTLLPALATADEVRVKRIRFEGVESIRKRVLLDHMLTRERKRLRFWRKRPEWSVGVFQEDILRIKQIYRDHGYYEAVVEGAFEERDEGRQVVVTIRVEEGEPVRLTSLSLELGPGAPIAAAELAASLPLREGDVFSIHGYHVARTAALEKLAELGHPAATLGGGAEVIVESRSAEVEWRIAPGSPVSFGAVRVEGLERVDEKIVRREIAIVEGERYSPEALRRTRNRLLRSRLFRYVAIQPEAPATTASEGDTPTSEDEAASAIADAATAETVDPGRGEAEPAAAETWPIVLTLEERPPRSIAIGAGWASGQGPRGSVRWTHRNFLGGARRLSVGASGSPIEQQANVRLQQPYLFETKATLVADSLWRRRSRDSYDWNTIEFNVGPRWTFGRRWVLETGYRFGWTNITNIKNESNEVLRAQTRSGLLSGFGVRARHARLDRTTDPRAGTWLQVGIYTNLQALGSDFDWMRYEAEARGYLPLGPTVAAFRARYRVIDPLRSTQADGVPLGERLFLGGPHTGRGFPFEKLGPLEDGGDPIGGVTSLLLSAEWRVPVWGPVTLVGFVDAGQVSLEPFGFETDDIGIGTGAGLAFSTPIGPVAFHLAYPVRPLEVSQHLRFAITIGHSF